MGARAFVWAGGGLFVASLTSCAWSYLVAFGRTAPWAGWVPVLIDAVLISMFAFHHSLFARERVKARLTQLIAAAVLRSTYVWIASLLLILVSLAWRTVGGEIYTITGLLAIALFGIQAVGLWITARGVARIDPLELAGIRPAAQTEGLQMTGPYHWVRHPLYLGWMLMVFGAPHMTGDRLTFAAFTTGYLMIAIPWEERSLRQSFGDAYAQYMRDVRWRMIPFIY
jgi:protein-S-isoprenylcysteine O-methyltransferase Ste14